MTVGNVFDVPVSKVVKPTPPGDVAAIFQIAAVKIVTITPKPQIVAASRRGRAGTAPCDVGDRTDGQRPAEQHIGELRPVFVPPGCGSRSKGNRGAKLLE